MIVPAKYYFSYILEQDIRSFKIHLRIDNADKYNEILTGVIKGFVNATDSKNYIYSPDSEVREFLNRIDGTRKTHTR